MEENQTAQQPAAQQPKTSKSGSKKSILIIILILIIVAAGAVILFKKEDKKSSTSTPSTGAQTEQQVAEVKITAGGFAPATVKVKQGTQVRWTNDDDTPHRVISDPHPTHNTLDDLDSEDTLNKNDTFAYTFTETGTFTYHAEEDSVKFKGTVIVE
jgi:plastocyanin